MFLSNRFPKRLSATPPPRARPQLEGLESRVVPYATSGNAWPNPQLVTISFQPDGTNLGGASSTLVSSFDSAFGSASAWQTPILMAAQTWAQYTNLNFAVVGDNGDDSGSGDYQQGDTNYGDIRVGGFDFGDSSILALTYMPPPVNNYSIAGDVAFNTAQVFNVDGQDYDLYSVALHEIGHALGLDHSTDTSAIMYPYYQGVETGISTDDVSGIQAIYGIRNADSFDATAPNGSFATASKVTSSIDATTKTALFNPLDITTTSDQDYYKFVAPAGSTTLNLTVQSAGLSLLDPSVKVYNRSQTQLASATGSGYLGSTLNLTVSVTPGQTYYVQVGGADNTAFGTGSYGMTLNFGNGSSPAINPPNTQTANGDPLNGGGGVAEHTDNNGLSVLAPDHSISTRPLPFVDLLTTARGPLPLAERPATSSASLNGPVMPGSSPERADAVTLLALERAVDFETTAAVVPQARFQEAPFLSVIPGNPLLGIARREADPPAVTSAIGTPAADWLHAARAGWTTEPERAEARPGEEAGGKERKPDAELPGEGMETGRGAPGNSASSATGDSQAMKALTCDAFFCSLASPRAEVWEEVSQRNSAGKDLAGLLLALGLLWAERPPNPRHKQQVPFAP